MIFDILSPSLGTAVVESVDAFGGSVDEHDSGMMAANPKDSQEYKDFLAKGLVPIVVRYPGEDGQVHEKVVGVKPGTSLLEVSRRDADLHPALEGACEGSLSCSTCHVILDAESFGKLPAPEEAEEDMLDLAVGLTSTSRLGCQVIVQPEFAGMVVEIPGESRHLKF